MTDLFQLLSFFPSPLSYTLFWKNKDVFPHGPVVKAQSPKQEFKIFFCFTGTKRVYQNLSVFKVSSFFLFCSQEQPKIIEPLDYEAEVFQRKAQIHNDPHRDLLLCPLDDVSVSTFIRSLPAVTVPEHLSHVDGAAAKDVAYNPTADLQ